MAFSFGASTTTAPATGFGFGATATTTTAAPATTGFGFGTTPAATTAAAPATTGFGFGTTTTTAATTAAAPAATTGFGFGTTTAATTPATTGFGFGPTTLAATPAAATAAAAQQPPAQQQPDPPIRLEQTLSTLTPSQQKKIAFLDEMIRGQGTYNEYLSNQVQALYSSYPLFFQSNDINAPVDTVHGKFNSALAAPAADNTATNPPNNANGEDRGYISPKQLLQLLSSLYLSITTDSGALKELDQELAQEEDNIDSAARQLSILLNDPAYLSNYNAVNNPTTPSVQITPGFGQSTTQPQQPQQPQPQQGTRAQYLSQFQQSSDLITVPSYYHWNKLASFQKRLVELQTRINTVSESLSTLGLLDVNSVDVPTLVLILTETLQNQSMSLLSTAVAVSNMSKKVKAYKEQTERILRHRGADQYTLNLLSQHRANKKHLDSSKIPLTTPTSANPSSSSSSSAPSTLLPEKTQLIPTVLGQPQAPVQQPGATPAAAAPTSAPTTGFGAPATTGFGFGAPAATTGFGFGTTAAAPTTGFGFGTTAPATTAAAPTTGFGFGTTPAAPAAFPAATTTASAPAASNATARPGVKRNGRRG